MFLMEEVQEKREEEEEEPKSDVEKEIEGA